MRKLIIALVFVFLSGVSGAQEYDNMIRQERTWGICPKCKKATKITEGISLTTLAYYPPTYNEYGENINPDRNTTRTEYTCHECGTKWSE